MHQITRVWWRWLLLKFSFTTWVSFFISPLFFSSRQIPDPLNNATRSNINLHGFPFSSASRGQLCTLTIHKTSRLQFLWQSVLIQLNCNSITFAYWALRPRQVLSGFVEIRDWVQPWWSLACSELISSFGFMWLSSVAFFRWILSVDFNHET